MKRERIQPPKIPKSAFPVETQNVIQRLKELTSFAEPKSDGQLFGKRDEKHPI